MKKNILSLSMLTFALTLCGCSILNKKEEIKPTPSGEPAQSSSSAQTSSPAAPTSEPASSSGNVKTVLKGTYKDISKATVYSNRLDYTPTTGTVNILVIPIWFSNSSTFISNKNNVRDDIETAYFGSKEETGWHSVKTFYETESEGKLTYNGVVSDWYSCGKSSQAFYSEGNGADQTEYLVTEAVNWYFNNNTDKKRTDFDSDKDGYLDGVMLIYGAPDYQAMNLKTAGNMWAYCYWLAPSGGGTLSRPVPNVFFWASYDFMYDNSTARNRAGNATYYNGDCSHCNIDAHTYIHEMGHSFGLDDYYDYGDYGYSPAAAFSMQDHNIGGHDPFSLMSYGWVDPIIPTESGEISISAFQTNHDVILLTPSWNSYDSPFDEYLLLELYTPTGLNYLDSRYSYSGEDRGPTSCGIRLWHVDARIAYATRFETVQDEYGNQWDSPVYTINQLTSDPNLEGARKHQEVAFNNSYMSDDFPSKFGDSYETYNLLQMIRSSTSETVLTNSSLKSTNLFTSSKLNNSFSMSKYHNQFPRGTKLNNGLDLGWSFEIKSITGDGDDVKATISLIKY